MKKGNDMNSFHGLALVAVGLIVQTASAQSVRINQSPRGSTGPQQSASAQARCKVPTGRLVEDFNPETRTGKGRLTHGGWLNGTTVSVDNSEGLPTPDPNVVTFTQSMTLTTAQGELKGSRVFLFNVVTGLGTDMTTIDPGASTGIFAGATGALYANGLEFVDIAVGPYFSVVVGKVCFAPGNEPGDR